MSNVESHTTESVECVARPSGMTVILLNCSKSGAAPIILHSQANLCSC